MKVAKINHIGFSLKEKIMWATTVVALLIVFSVSLYFSYATYSSMVVRGEAFVSERSDMMKQRIMSNLDSKFAVLDYIASLPEVYGMDKVTQQGYLSEKVDSVGFEYMFVVNNDKEPFFINSGTDYDLYDEDIFKFAVSNYRYISDPYYDQKNNAPLATLCVSIYDEDDQKVGALCGALNLNVLYSEIKNMYSTGIIAAITQNGEYVLYEDVASVIAQDNALDTFSDSPVVVDFISKGLHSPKTISSHLGYHDDVYYVGMSDLNYCHWKIIYIMKDDLIMRGVWNILVVQSVSIIMMILAFILIFRHQYWAIKTKSMAYTDDLTGLGNAQKCHEMLNYFNELEDNTMLICFDLNKFKEINDTLGHQMGDEALKVFSNCLKISFGTEGFIGRIGGDEFISILSGDVHKKYEISLTKLNEAIEHENNSENSSFKLSVSHGISIRESGNTPYKSINAMYYEADKNMYENKKIYHDSLSSTDLT
ncbi:sensor domain-containing diguanylate cyclase [Oribacterium sp. P6A1]|uniref:sensor domain-containing diguanylate cyclase n=1 Tax=Oribacterium sp. P6A1 TaxID=1410612 RepID=UPI00068E1F86|nr:sensor domain-containing diguanylate cyclase [Oribacterium sp. P6A1]